MKRTMCCLMSALLVTGCGGRAANPVMVQQYGDQRKSCAALEREMVNAQQEIARLVPEADKGGKNAALGVAGALVLIPWFFMDFGHAEEEEINAYRQRYNNLASIAEDKRCDIDTRPIPPIRSRKDDAEKPKHLIGPDSKQD